MFGFWRKQNHITVFYEIIGLILNKTLIIWIRQTSITKCNIWKNAIRINIFLSNDFAKKNVHEYRCLKPAWLHVISLKSSPFSCNPRTLKKKVYILESTYLLHQYQKELSFLLQHAQSHNKNCLANNDLYDHAA